MSAKRIGLNTRRIEKMSILSLVLSVETVRFLATKSYSILAAKS